MNDRAGKSRLRRAAGVTKDTSCPSASRAFIGRGKLLAWRDTTAEREKCPLASSALRNRANLRRGEARCACATKGTSCPSASSALRNGANFRRGETRCACAVKDTSCPSASSAPRNGANLRRGETRCACAMEGTLCPRGKRHHHGTEKVASRVQRTTEWSKFPAR